MEKRVSTMDLQEGMYVCQLDRPWLETPFLLQGFFVRSPDDIEQLQKHCKFVVIDLDLSNIAYQVKKSFNHAKSGAKAYQALPHRPNLKGLPKDLLLYENTVPMDAEIGKARVVYEQAQTLVYDIMEEIRSGNKLSGEGLQVAAYAVVNSVLRNPNAMIWLTNLKQKDSYTYNHSIDSCSIAVALGRHLGLPQEELQHVACGSILCDIGKMKLPSELLSKPGKLTESEFNLVKRHVEYGVELIKEAACFSDDVITIVQEHHERFNGSGYPQGISAHQISLYSSIAGLVDCFDAMTSPTAYRVPVSRHTALRELYAVRNTLFQDELVEQFIQCIGAYPTGTVVELSSGEIGIVIEQNRWRRLSPKLMLLLDTEKIPYDTNSSIDLLTHTEDKHGKPLEIVKAVDPENFGIDPSEFYLQ